MITTERASAEFEQLQARKRLVYLVALGCSLPILLLSWYFRDPADHYLTYIYPLAAVSVVALLGLIWLRSVSLQTMEAVMMAFWSSFILSRLGWHFHAGDGIDAQLLTLVGGHYWAVATLMVAGFVMLDRQRGLIAGTCILIGSALLTLSGIMVDSGRGQLPGEAVMFLIRIHVFLLAMLALVTAVAGMRDQLQRALARSDILDKWANTDMLTQLANRRAAGRLLSGYRSESVDDGTPLSVIISDIDHFKRVNDEHGHATGDTVIAHVARVLRATVRESDTVSRWGGEEFLVVVPGARLRDAVHLAHRCREAIKQTPVAGVTVTATFGVAEYLDGESIDALLARADRCLYAGKNAGRDIVVAHDGEPRPGDDPEPANAPGHQHLA